MSEILKGNFEVKRQVVDKENDGPAASDSERIVAELRERALASLGGSMVYVERTALTWDGEPADKKPGS